MFLVPLSPDNTTPEIALNESRPALENIGLRVGGGMDPPDDIGAAIQLGALPRFDCSRLYTLRI